MNFFAAPRVSLLARPEFVGVPKHIDWVSDSDVGAEELVEFSGRLCYLSFGSGSVDGHKTIAGRTTNDEYLENIKRTKHGSVTEHAVWSMLFEGVSRSLTHELVRHRHFSYSQLSQRYVDESEVAFVVPPALVDSYNAWQPGGPITPISLSYRVWRQACLDAAQAYRSLVTVLAEEIGTEGESKTLLRKRVRETARAVLPNCTETKIVVTGNVRMWRFFFEKRGAIGADAEIRRLAIAAWEVLTKESPGLFGDITRVQQDGKDVLQLKYEGI